MRKIIASLDIGDYTFKLAIGEVLKGKLNVLACVETPSRGVKKGFVINIESTTLALQELFDKAEDVVGIRPRKVLISVPSNNVEFFLAEGYASINNENNLVGSNDIIKALQSCVYNKLDGNRELVSILPTKFLINDTDIVDNPLGMEAYKLNVKAVIITVPKKNIVNIIRCLNNIGVKVIDSTLGALGDYYLFKNKEYDSTVGAVINIGSSLTSVSIFNRGIMTNNEIIAVGGDLVDYDLVHNYKIKREDANYLKEKLAICDKNMTSVSESIVCETKNGEKVKINQYEASEIVINRLQEILNLAKKQINLLTKKQISYIIITGGVSEALEFNSIVNNVFNNACIGNVNIIGARNNKYSTVLGLIKYYDSRLKLRNKDFSIYTIEEQEELSGIHKKINISENSILGKLFGYFFDN